MLEQPPDPILVKIWYDLSPGADRAGRVAVDVGIGDSDGLESRPQTCGSCRKRRPCRSPQDAVWRPGPREATEDIGKLDLSNAGAVQNTGFAGIDELTRRHGRDERAHPIPERNHLR